MEKITKNNCLEWLRTISLHGDINAQSRAWMTVVTFCRQNGMSDKGLPSVEGVITFIDDLLKIKESKDK